MRVPIVILALVASPFIADVAVAQSKPAARKESQVSEWFKSLEDRWKGWMDKKEDKCDKNDKKGKDNDHGKGRGHNDNDRCDAKPTTTPPPTPAPTPTPTPAPPPPPPAPTGAEISGVLYSDLNFNGARDAGEPALTGWTVQLTSGATTTTDANGLYKFSALPVGSYTVCATALTGWSQVMPNRGDICASGAKGFLIDVLAASDVFSAKDFGFTSATGG